MTNNSLGFCLILLKVRTNFQRGFRVHSDQRLFLKHDDGAGLCSFHNSVFVSLVNDFLHIHFRQKRVKINFSNLITSEHILSLSRKDVSIRLKQYNVDELQPKEEDMEEEDIEPEPSKYDGKCHPQSNNN